MFNDKKIVNQNHNQFQNFANFSNFPNFSSDGVEGESWGAQLDREDRERTLKGEQ